MSPLPDTHIALSQAEHSRLVRSSRKLQALLGETPQVIENALAGEATRKEFSAPAPEGNLARRRAAKTLSSRSSSPSPSHSGSTLTLAKSAVALRPYLLLHLERPVAQLHTPKHTYAHSLSPPPTPLSPTNSIALNSGPSTPPVSHTSHLSLSSKGTAPMRRRQAAKLARTLDENIAPTLDEPAYPLPAVPVSVPPARGLRRAASTLGRSKPPPASVFAFNSDIMAKRTPLQRPAKPALSAPVVSEASVPNSTPETQVPAPAPAPLVPRSLSTLVRSLSTAAHGRGRHPLIKTPRSHRRAQSVASPSTSQNASESHDSHSELISTADTDAERQHWQRRRKEKGWSGEWNQEVGAVAKQLRRLK
ncbi:hypothetical protein B0H11DRAFT_2276958 [Mycena galericulata]|nr:hypothetical protein B0H11DRAFT_2276958 [Mycena galericulata]